MRRYSRLITVQEKKHRRQTFIWIMLSLVLLVVLIFWGVPTLANFSAFLADLKGEKPAENNDKIVPAPPLLATTLTATNSAKFKLEGSGEPKSKVIIFHNGKPEEIDIHEDGSFTYNASLVEGKNTFSGKVKDNAGNESQDSKEHIVSYDIVAPEIEVINPQDGQTFQGTQEQNLTLDIKTDEETSLTVNDRLATELDENEYSFQTKLTDGENSFNIKAKDEAGNETEKTIVVTFFP